MNLKTVTGGVLAIAPTPFQADGSIDYQSIDRLAAYYEEVGCTGITVLGMMGEATKLDNAEARSVAERFIKRSKIPVVVGVSSPGFAAMSSLSRASMDAGAAGVMIAPIATLRADEHIVTYFSQACDAIGRDVPWVIQDFPLGIGVQMTTSVLVKVIEQNPSCIMLKHEDWPGLEKLSALRDMQASGKLRPIVILCGNGGMFLDFELTRGADGAMTGYAFPEMLVAICRAARDGKRTELHDAFDAHLPLIRYEQQPGAGLAVRKYVMMRRGLISSDTQRVPAGKLSARAIEEIEFLLSRIARTDPLADVDGKLERLRA
jgi:4-hydroxy-tetrahydrodipicolinate synthase